MPLIAMAILLSAAMPAHAEDTSSAANARVDLTREAEPTSLAAFAAAHPGCGEWTDGCTICVRRRDASFGCSLPGIACQPTALTCRPPQAPAGAK